MRIFYEEWDKVLNHPPLADDLVLNEKLLLVEMRVCQKFGNAIIQYCYSAKRRIYIQKVDVSRSFTDVQDDKMIGYFTFDTLSFNWSDFLSIGFSHHIEIIAKAKTLEASLF